MNRFSTSPLVSSASRRFLAQAILGLLLTAEVLFVGAGSVGLWQLEPPSTAVESGCPVITVFPCITAFLINFLP